MEDRRTTTWRLFCLHVWTEDNRAPSPLFWPRNELGVDVVSRTAAPHASVERVLGSGSDDPVGVFEEVVAETVDRDAHVLDRSHAVEVTVDA
ncbi:unnamed protein product [Phytophthora fragariaefolia]|uniref:Unnamed protein product n=1 Tax=Phytophthora fragariaefolia TaxID=1490495 RepID=A0A9W6XU21_9STRA|nr:unnamed protein product [Phytophthora fragariaefolia]